MAKKRPLCKTGIEVLDELLNGGIPAKLGVMVAGGPGTGKTILAQQILFNGADKFGDKGVYLGLTEVRDKMVENMRAFDFYNQEAVDNGDVTILDATSTEKVSQTFFTGPTERTRVLGHSIASLIKDVVEENDAKRLVIDSLTSIYEKFENNADMRAFVFELLSNLRDLNCTAFFISEINKDRPQYSVSGIEEFMLDGLIHLSDYEYENDLERTLRVIKMRGTAHSRIKHVMLITSSGVVLTPMMKS